MEKHVIKEINRLANLDLYNRILKKTLLKNIMGLENMIGSMKRTSGPVTVSYRGKSVIVGFAEDPADMRCRVVDILEDVLADNRIALDKLVGRKDAPDDLSEDHKPSRPLHYVSYDENGDVIEEDTDE